MAKTKKPGREHAIPVNKHFAEDQKDHSILYSIMPTGHGRSWWLQKNGRAMVHCGSGVYVSTRSRSVINVLQGFDDVRDWDDDELRFGRRRDPKGNLSGVPPRVIPLACHQELARRVLQEAETRMRDEVLASVEQLLLIAKGEIPARSDQVRAIAMHLERVLGKPIEHIDINANVEAPWMRALTGGIVGDSRAVEAEVIDINAIDDEDDVAWDDV